MATSLLSTAAGTASSFPTSSGRFSRVFLRGETSSAAFGGRHTGFRKLATQRTKKCQQQQQRGPGAGAGGVQAASIRPRRITRDENEVLPVSPDEPGFYSGSQVIQF